SSLVEHLVGLPDLAHVRVVVAAGEGPFPAEILGVRLVRFDEWLVGVRDDQAWPFPTADQPCQIQYTSGTTARAKGVVIPHHFAYLYGGACADSQHRTEEDVLSAPLPLSHAGALHVIAGSALHAGC